MNCINQKSSAILLINLVVLLASCAEPPNYAPVKMVNQALEPNNGYYLLNKSSQIPKNNQIYSHNSYEKLSAGVKKVPGGADRPLTKTKQITDIKSAKNIKSTEKGKLMASVIEKTEVSKSLKPVKSTQKTDGQDKNKLILSMTKVEEIQAKQRLKTNSADNFLLTPTQNKKASISIDNKKMLKLNFQWPLKGKITKNFSQTDNKGILIKGKSGQAVHAAESGKAVYCGHGLAGFGNLAIIKHNESFLSAYANNSKLFIKEGERVEKGQTIGEVGLTGLRSSSLHFEIRKNGKPINPLTMLPKH